MNTNRRIFLTLALALAAMCALGGGTAWSAETKAAKKIPLAVQLYAVRGEFAKDVPGTLKPVAEMGYKGVEFWGYDGTENVYQNYSAAQLRKMLDDNGLKCCGMHVNVKALEPANLELTIKNNKILGNNLLNVASATKQMESEASIKAFAAFLNDASKKCAAQKMRVGYHAHGFDFNKLNGKMAYEILFSQLDPAVNMQIDIGHCLNAGADPVAIFKEFPGRSRTVHLREVKDKDKTFDSPGYKEIFDACENIAGTRWYIVEEEAGTSFDFSRQAIEKLHKIGK